MAVLILELEIVKVVSLVDHGQSKWDLFLVLTFVEFRVSYPVEDTLLRLLYGLAIVSQLCF